MLLGKVDDLLQRGDLGTDSLTEGAVRLNGESWEGKGCRMRLILKEAHMEEERERERLPYVYKQQFQRREGSEGKRVRGRWERGGER